jgi:demethylmenaquinone methyltransferase / 2-methoxy-6-polyprenyl-1,4-benzoquinol methylase
MSEPDMNKPAPEKQKEQIRRMFNSIAHRYDFLNHFLSAGIDRRWRNAW